MTTTHEPHPETASTDSSWWSEVGWVHLVYLAFLIPQPIYDPDSGLWDWVLVVGIVLVFLPLYVFAWVRPDLARWGSVVPMTALGVVTTPLNSGAAVLFVYAAAIAGVRESRRIALRWFIGLTVVLCVLVSFSPVPLPQRLWGLGPPLVFIWIIGLTQIEQAERDREAAELRLRNARVEHLATVSERERIARELHDLLGHSLTSMIMHAQLCQNLVEVDPARAREAAAKAERTARAALTEVRAAVSGLRQASLDAELESARETLSSVGVELVTRCDRSLRLVGSTEHGLALALREAITNVARHARARSCCVSLSVVDEELRLVIADDGTGGRHRAGNGLAGMRERISVLGGRVEWSGSAGTTVTIAVPLRVAT
ncbi:sensor histidine kinase [Saccharomonospora viridis]|uniref:Signal transduction histidine kinase n=3 Tax=Saccharomonospora viridis TaxID=1852 RepID=C7MSU2_SACVD|nr:sensor histidine kinase [Saccharomonospora viridis]ACU95303.1 signal transduction histidine kinase [Saccharomonospora viridis DSM 43017]KHF44934.1 histidine kinase [Saccharomonospora viridis]SFP17473.1 two-component system, NarL family, sensor histidine kinase DesK [Saccharomonospora viridis]